MDSILVACMAMRQKRLVKDASGTEMLLSEVMENLALFMKVRNVLVKIN